MAFNYPRDHAPPFFFEEALLSLEAQALSSSYRNPIEHSKKKIRVLHLGQVDYLQSLELQHQIMEKRYRGELSDTLLLLQHPHTFTLGRLGEISHLNVPPEKLDQMGIPLHRTGRGGDITYHGPGQLVGYPIVDLKGYKRDIGRYLRNLEEVLLRTLAVFGLVGERQEGLTGVWVRGKKIASIGIGVRRWITYHGFSLNIDPHLEYFDMIIPCGLKDRETTSMGKLLGKPPDFGESCGVVSKEFLDVFG